MAKFYVTSGQIRECIQADDAEGAALEALDRFLAGSAWIFDDERLTDADRRAQLATECLLNLAPEFRVSQRGFGDDACECDDDRGATGLPPRSDAQYFPTADLADTHFRVAIALRRFVAGFGYAPCGVGIGAETRGMLSLAG